jgi:hypothetical protein
MAWTGISVLVVEMRTFRNLRVDDDDQYTSSQILIGTD